MGWEIFNPTKPMITLKINSTQLGRVELDRQVETIFAKPNKKIWCSFYYLSSLFSKW